METPPFPCNPTTVGTPRLLDDACSVALRSSQVVSRRPRPVEFDRGGQYDHPGDFRPRGSTAKPRGQFRLVSIGVIAVLAVFTLGSYAKLDFSSMRSERLSQTTTALYQLISDVASQVRELLPNRSGEHLGRSITSSQRLLTTDLSGAINLPIALGVSVQSPQGGGHILIQDLPSGSRLTAGAADGDGSWRVAVGDVVRAAVVPPHGYVGPMELRVDLRLFDGTVVDSAVLRLEWTAAAGDMIIPKSVKTTAIPVPEITFPPPSPQR
jgi:hypothetical protein